MAGNIKRFTQLYKNQQKHSLQDCAFPRSVTIYIGKILPKTQSLVCVQCLYDYIYCYNNVQNFQFLIHFNIKGNGNWQNGFHILVTGWKGEAMQSFDHCYNYSQRCDTIIWHLLHSFTEKIHNHLTAVTHIHREVPQSLSLYTVAHNELRVFVP